MRKILIAAAIAFALIAPGQAVAQSQAQKADGKKLLEYVCSLDDHETFPEFPISDNDLQSLSKYLIERIDDNGNSTLTDRQSIFMAGFFLSLKASSKCPDTFK